MREVTTHLIARRYARKAVPAGRGKRFVKDRSAAYEQALRALRAGMPVSLPKHNPHKSLKRKHRLRLVHPERRA